MYVNLDIFNFSPESPQSLSLPTDSAVGVGSWDRGWVVILHSHTMVVSKTLNKFFGFRPKKEIKQLGSPKIKGFENYRFESYIRFFG